MEFSFEFQPGQQRIRTFSPPIEEAKVSIITAYYNAGEYFEQTFNSVMNQTFPWFEWIIVDDGSTKKEDLETLEKFASMDGRIKVIHQKNAGPSSARNAGIKASQTDFFVPLDADDLITASFLECLYWTLQQHSDADWAYTDSCGFQDQEYEWKPAWNTEKMKTDNFLTVTAMIRKQVAEEIGFYKVEQEPYHEDWRFWLDMLAKGKKPIHIGEVMFWYRRANDGRLSNVEQSTEHASFSKRIIEEAAERVKENVQAYEFPRKEIEENYCATRFQKYPYCNAPDEVGTGVLWLIPWMELGGADKFNLDAVAGLSKKGYRNCIITTEQSSNSWKQKFERVADEIFELPSFMDRSSYLSFISYYIQTRNIQVLLVSNSYDGYHMIPWIRAHFPELVIVDYVHMEEWYWRGGGFARLSGAMGDIVEKTWVCNSSTREVIRTDFDRTDPETVQCLYIGVDHHQFSKYNEKEGFLHEKLGIAAERPVVLFPCRIHPQKRPFLMLEIAKAVHATMPQVAFAVVGDGPQLDELKETITAMGLDGVVYCLGRCNDMRACYRDSKVTLICSLKEGLALTAYESCAMGVPVVSSDVGGQRDLIDATVGAIIPLYQQENAENLDSRTFPVEEVQVYVKHLIRILSNESLQEEMGKAARQKIEEGFSLEKMVENLDAELVHLLTDTEAREKRKEVSEAMQKMQHFAADYYTVYHLWQQNIHRFERKSQEAEEVWAAKEWFRAMVDENASAELNMIKNSNAWKLIERCRKFESTSKIGHLAGKLARKMVRKAK